MGGSEGKTLPLIEGGLKSESIALEGKKVKALNLVSYSEKKKNKQCRGKKPSKGRGK